MAKIDMFDRKVDNSSDGEKKLNTWYDSLIGCPLQMTTKLVEENKMPERKIKTWHVGEIKVFDIYLQMEVRDYIARHDGELAPGDGVYVNPDTADIFVTTIDKVTDRQNFYPFTSLVEYDKEDGKYYVNKDATGDVAFTYYEYL